MYFIFFVTFLVLTLMIIAIGLFRPEHTELSIIGFLFLFLLSFTIINGNIEYKTGVNETNEYACLCCSNGMVTPSPGICNENNTNLVISKVNKVDIYTTYNPTGLFSHWVGYYLAVASLIGFVGVMIGIKFTRFK